jgi:hypothetical protein
LKENRKQKAMLLICLLFFVFIRHLFQISDPMFSVWRVLAVCSLVLSCTEATSASPSTYSATLRGTSEVPANGSSAGGTASLTISGQTLTYDVTATGFTTPLVVAHIQIGASGTIGPVIIPFDILAQSGTIAHGTVDLSRPVSYNTLTISGDSLRSLFSLGLTYVNLHTAAYPGGEIRGQIFPR